MNKVLLNYVKNNKKFIEIYISIRLTNKLSTIKIDIIIICLHNSSLKFILFSLILLLNFSLFSLISNILGIIIIFWNIHNIISKINSVEKLNEYKNVDIVNPIDNPLNIRIK